MGRLDEVVRHERYGLGKDLITAVLFFVLALTFLIQFVRL
jgi:hypothetical protein